MSPLYDPKDRGFPESLSTIDRCQIAMLRDLASSDARLILKGGMAMRVVVGSMRLTKDIDFDRAAGISTNAVKAGVSKALNNAAQSARLLSPEVASIKVTDTTVRMRLSGTASGELVKFVVEVSGRDDVPQDGYSRVTVVPPARYGIAPFSITAYTHDMLAASKVLAVMSTNRNVPRDIFDLNDLAGAQPQGILRRRLERQTLEAIKQGAMEKICAIDYAQAQLELLPYIPHDLRENINRFTWEDMALGVAENVQRWVTEALASDAGPG